MKEPLMTDEMIEQMYGTLSDNLRSREIGELRVLVAKDVRQFYESQPNKWISVKDAIEKLQKLKTEYQKMRENGDNDMRPVIYCVDELIKSFEPQPPTEH